MKFFIPSLLLVFTSNVSGTEYDPTPINQLLQEELESPRPQIVGGVEVDPKFKYPYMVRAGGCGASLVAPNVLLCAAHCVNAFSSVQIGRHDLDDNSETFETFSILEKVQHPNYDDNSLDYDFMMVRMDGSSTRTPVVLDDGTVSLDSGNDVIVMGWGTTSAGGSASRILLEAEVDLVSKDDCQNAYSGITDRMVCAARNGKDSCQGDSGGPMIDKATGRQVGVVSWGISCALPQYPGVYAKVQDQIDWIQSYIDRWSDGSTPAPTPAPTPPPPPSDCEDYPSWTDFYGDDCSWYETFDDPGCPNYGEVWGNPTTGILPSEACCHCGGGTNTDDPPTPAPTCSNIDLKGECNGTAGCSWNAIQGLCLDALSTEECQQWDGKRRKCRRNGCKWKRNTRTCKGRWD